MVEKVVIESNLVSSPIFDKLFNFQVILTNAPCVNPHLKGVCPHGITVSVNKNEILLAQSEKDLNKVMKTSQFIKNM